jgi:endonuclease YncB( thermonuclease family)
LAVRLNLGATLDRVQGTAAVALGLAAIVLLFVYLVPRQPDIAASMQARWARMQASAEVKSGRVRPAASGSVAEAPAGPDAAPAAAAPGPPPEQGVETASGTPSEAPQPDAPIALAPPVPASAAPPSDGAGAQLLARPVVLDTATILIRRGKVRLEGIEAASLSRKCGEDGPRGWLCGVEARTRFRSWLRARSISCNVPKGFGNDTQEVEARCDLGGTDIGKWLVENGFAEASPGGPYAEAQAKAKAAKLGIWAESRFAN